MKQRLVFLGLALGGLTLNTNAQQCDLSITGTVPEGISLDKLVVSTYDKELPVTSRDYSLCASKQDLQVVGRHSPNNTIYLMDKSGAIPRGIYTAEVFIQSEAITLGPASSLTKQVCNLRCGYYASQRVQNSKELQQLAAEYQLLSATDGKAIGAFLSQNQAKLDRIYYGDIHPKPSAPINTGDLWVDPYSGAGLYFDAPETILNSTFRDYVSSEARAARQQDEAVAKAMKQHKASLQGLMKGFNSWQERVEAVNRVSAELKASQDPAAIKVAQIFERGLEEAEATLKSYLTNDNKTPIASLTRANKTFELLLADWTNAAYIHSKDKQAFAALFSEQFKQQLPIQDRELDKALSRLIDLPNHLGKLSIEDGYQNIQLEFNNLLPDSNQRYDFKDALHSVSFVYEKGAWRLDSVSQLPIRHYDQG
ncbi:hypothetical protein ACFFLG_01990 [Shewanella indica]|uniref:hypothetical protein n=1 Tax=Shewanella indica TaxID=768528 RepID=UPI000C32A655|nr:hypothetical protein [Shewanella indica]GHB00937.1 hypothetical protein GCM10007107_12330 [Shewanella indica]